MIHQNRTILIEKRLILFPHPAYEHLPFRAIDNPALKDSYSDESQNCLQNGRSLKASGLKSNERANLHQLPSRGKSLVG
jgi:hypothetical protein